LIFYGGGFAVGMKQLGLPLISATNRCHNNLTAVFWQQGIQCHHYIPKSHEFK